MVPEKRKTVPVEKLSYSNIMKFEKTKKWKDSKIKTEDNKDRKREERKKKQENDLK